MAPNILVNDGGAPARIMKLGLADAAIDAGTFVGIHTDGTISASTLTSIPEASNAVGVLFVDAVSGEPASVMTGSGLMCFLKSTGTIALGANLSHNGDGLAVDTTNETDGCLAVALEAKGATHTGYTKVLLR
tara:strand:+ start:162 stop:557 length:396 start_codon:yes stop_codon:yes gene_type:complete